MGELIERLYRGPARRPNPNPNADPNPNPDQVSSGAFAMLNGYDPAQTYAAGVSAAEAA